MCEYLVVSAGSVPMAKVRWDARSEDQYIQNYKILQRVFEKHGIDKVRKLLGASNFDTTLHSHTIAACRCYEAGQSQISGQFGIHAVDEKLLRSKLRNS
jgi:hypothetical protein